MTRRHIASALYAEGPTDHRFLRGLLPRAIETLGAEYGYDLIEVSPLRQLAIPETAGSGREDRVAAAVLADEAAFHVLFLHADADGDEAAARRDRIHPAIAAVRTALGDNKRGQVGVVPVQTTEAWALADLASFQAALSTTRTASELGIPPTPALLEADQDPKAALDQAVRLARPGRTGRRRPSGEAFLDVLGESVSIGALRELSAYRAFEWDLHAAISSLGHMPSPS